MNNKDCFVNKMDFYINLVKNKGKLISNILIKKENKLQLENLRSSF